MALYEKLTATSTPGEIAAAYKEFTGLVGGDTQDAQTSAVDYLTGLGISAPTITQAYDMYRAPTAQAVANTSGLGTAGIGVSGAVIPATGALAQANNTASVLGNDSSYSAPVNLQTGANTSGADASSSLSSIERLLVSKHGFVDNGDGTLTTPGGRLYDYENGGSNITKKAPTGATLPTDLVVNQSANLPAVSLDALNATNAAASTAATTGLPGGDALSFGGSDANIANTLSTDDRQQDFIDANTVRPEVKDEVAETFKTIFGRDPTAAELTELRNSYGSTIDATEFNNLVLSKRDLNVGYGVPTTQSVTPVYGYRDGVGEYGETIQVPYITGYKDQNGNAVDPSLVTTTTDGEGGFLGYEAPVTQLNYNVEGGLVNKLTTQILNQGTTAQWSGEGYGSATKNAADMALLLAAAGLTDINQLGVRDKTITTEDVLGENGEIIQPATTYTQPEYYNKATGEAINPYYDKASGNTWGGTFAGEGSTAYKVNFQPDGTPIFYTQYGGSSNDLAQLMEDPLIGALVQAAASYFGGPLGTAALNLAAGRDAEDVGKAALASWVAGQVGDIVSGSQDVVGALGQTGANVAGRVAGSVVSGGGKDAALQALLTGGVGAAMPEITSMIPGYGDLSVEQRAFVNSAISSTLRDGNLSPQDLVNAAFAAGRAAKQDITTGGITNRIPDDMTEAGAAAFADAKRAGASDADALEASNALTRIAEANETFDGSGLESQNAAMNAAIADGKDKFTFGGKTFTIDNSAAQIADLEKSVAADTAARAASDPEWGNLAGAVTDATARNTVTIGNAEANDLTEAAALAKVRDPSASSFTYGGKTYTMTASDSQMNDAVRADKLNLISSAPKFSDAYSQARELLGAGKTFEWNGKTYSTDTRAENPVIAAASDATRLNNIAASTTAGGGRGSYLGYNSVEDAASKANLTTTKTNELLGYINDDQGGGYDALGNPIGGQTIGASADLSTTSGKIANGVANAMNTFFGVVANAPVDAVRAGGNLMSNVGGILDLVSGGPTEAGNKLRSLADQVDTFTSSISDPKIKAGQQAIGDAVDKAEGLIGKGQALATAAWDNPLGAASWIFTEGFEEVPGVGIALKVGRALGAGSTASKVGVFGTTIANDMIESGGAAYNDTYKEAIKTMPEAEARIAARNSAIASMAVTGVTQGIVEGKVLNKVIGKDTAGEFFEGSLQSGATQLALGQDLNVNKMLTQGVIEAGVGKGASSTASGVTATNIDTGTASGTSGAATGLGTVGAVTPGGTSTVATTGATNLGSVGAATPGGDVVTSNDLGAIGSVTPGGDAVVSDASTLAGAGATTGAQNTTSVADAQTAMGDLGLNVSDTTAVDLATKINNVTTQIGSGADASTVVGNTVTGAINAGSNASTVVGSTVNAAVAAGGNASTVVGSSVTAAVTAGANASTVVGSSVTAAVTAGADASTVVGSAVTAAANAGANVDTSVASSVSAAVAAGSNATTAVTAAADAAIAAGNNVTVSTDANSTTVTNATTNTTTTVNNTTGVATTVDANTNVTTTVDAATGTTTAVDANTNVTTQTTVNGDTSTTVVADANANINTQIVVDANTGTTTSTTVDATTNTTTQTTNDVNTSTQTTVVTDTNTNTQTTINVNTDTGEVISEEETTIPDNWTPPKIDVPVVPSVPKPPTVTPPKAPAPAAPKLMPQLPAGSATGAGGVVGLPSGINVDPASLRSKVIEGAIDPLARVKAAQAELERDVMMNQMDPRFLAAIQQRSNPQQQTKQFDDDIGALSKLLRGEPEAPANQSKYYSYGSEDSIDDILGGRAANYKEGGFVEPLKASGGSMALPLLAKSGGALGHYQGRENFKEGKHVAGKGDGQSDDIPAWLADGEFVFPADVVSALGNGSTKAGTDKLYEMMHSIRDRARSKGPKDLPPPALKSPLNYLKSSKRSTL